MITAFKAPTGVVAGPTYLPFIDFQPTLQAWRDILAGIRGEFFHTTLNSTIVSLSAATIATATGAMAAYALVRFTFKVKLASGLAFFVIAMGGYLIGHEYLDLGRAQALMLSFVVALTTAVLVNRLPMPGPVLGNTDIVFWFVSQRMFPPIVTAFALYLMYTELGRLGFRLVDTYVGLTLCYVAFSLPIVVWLMRDFFQALPIEVEEAAMVDNVPHWRIFGQIVLPMAAPGLGCHLHDHARLHLERVPFRPIPHDLEMANPAHPGSRPEQPARRRMVGDLGGCPDRHRADAGHGGAAQPTDALGPHARRHQIS